MSRLPLALLFVAACSPGDAPSGRSPATTASTPTTPEPSEGATRGLVWVDATGAVVEGAVDYLGDLALVDEDGNLWALDAWSGRLDGHLSPENGASLFEVFTDAACTSAAYPIEDMHPPHVVMEVQIPDDGGVKYIAAAPDAEPTIVETYNGGANCDPRGDGLYILASDTMEVTPPPVTWTAPLHPEP